MSSQGRRERVATTFAAAFRDGSWEPFMMALRGAHDLGVAPADWMADLASQVVDAYPSAPHDAPRQLASFIGDYLGNASRSGEWNEVLDWIGGNDTTPELASSWSGPRMVMPVAVSMGPRRWSVPTMDTTGDVEKFLNLRGGELDWYADVKSFERTVTAEDLRHYDYYWREKRSGGYRLLEAPKQNLKSIQRRVLDQIVNQIPPHDAAHGFRKGHSIQTYAEPHVGRDILIRLDLRAFFASVRAGRVFGIFKTAGYAEQVAYVLTGLTTNATPISVLAERPGRPDGDSSVSETGWLRSPHLPQGAPSSPALANLAAYRLDLRLTALAATFDATYTRYADDLAISGGPRLLRRRERFVEIASEIARHEGFHVNETKTRYRTQDQRQVLTGMVVNQHLNTHRRDYDRLKAILHDAAANGPEHANRSRHRAFRAHLEGRIGFVQATNPYRARKLWRLFDAVDWT